jgi:hypothetical protein
MRSEERALRDAATALKRFARRLLAVVSTTVDLLAAGQVDESGVGTFDLE